MSGPFDLSGKVALVTGCRRGIGQAIAVALAAAGADVLGVSVQLEDDGGEVGAQVRDLGRRFEGRRADFADRAQVYDTVAWANERGPVDILVANAGTNKRAPALEYADDDWDRLLEVNLTAPFVLARELGRAMAETGHGKIIFTASLLSFQGGIFVPAYAASKSGIAGVIRALGNECAPRGVQVNGIAPGYIATDITSALRDDPGRNDEIMSRIPAGRWGTPEDLAGAAVFLASSASDYVCGQIITVDGGWMSR